jgi:hypothetical protein
MSSDATGVVYRPVSNNHASVKFRSEKGRPTMNSLIVGGLGLLAVGLVASQLFRLRDWLNRQPPPDADPAEPEFPGGSTEHQSP